ncbi:MAG: hypothetical protein ACLFN0_04295 [Thermovirgaceae bacterium]
MERRGRGVSLDGLQSRDWRYRIVEDSCTDVTVVITADGWEESRSLSYWFEANRNKKVRCVFSEGSILHLCAVGIAVHESGHWSETVMKMRVPMS